jgi:Ca2+-transporting ATPase
VNPAENSEGWHALPAAAVLAFHQTTAGGLSPAEARARLQRAGPNELPAAARRPVGLILLAQFRSPLIYLLLLAAALALLLGEWRDAGVILVVVMINALIGAFQEGRAQRSMEALRRLAAVAVRVLREGREQNVPARELVVGDVMLLAAGDAVAADARLLEASALMASESALTGESVPVAKQAEPLAGAVRLADRSNMIFSGTHLTAGRGRAVVVATGRTTEVGKIARLTAAAREPSTPLEIRIAQLGRQLVTAAILLCLLIMTFGWWREIPARELLLITISQMVSLVPEGLPVALTIALAVGMQRMARRGAIIRRLAAVETLGSTSVICTDKTGTLTKGEMTVTALGLPGAGIFSVSGTGYEPEGRIEGEAAPGKGGADAGLERLLVAGALCNDAQLVPPGDADPRWRALGDPTEAALLTLALKGGLNPAKLVRATPRRAELPFDPVAKLMATQHGPAHGAGTLFLKGAPEVVLEWCGWVRRHDGIRPLTMAARQEALGTAGELGSRALRVLALAEIPDAMLDEDAGFAALAGRGVFLGLVGQMDPPREEVTAAIAACRAAGIRPVMVTGDHQTTGLALARMLGLARPGDRAVDGSELEAMPEQDLRSGLEQIAVFARVLPAQKLRIVEAFQAEGHVVAMTGDGVNDAPALARADVGVAMGLTGTEVAKNAAKIVITDDNFATLVHAIQEGRLVYANIRKLLLFLLATSIDEVLILVGALLAGCPLPLFAVQILWINLITEGALTINLVMEGPEGNEMRHPPVRAGARLIDLAMVMRMATMVAASVAATLGFYFWRLSTSMPLALVQTETFTLLAVCQWFNVLNCESTTRSVLRLGIWRNKWLMGGLVLANGLQLAVVYWEPLNRLFHTVPIPAADFLLIGAVASVVLWTEELRKLLTGLRRSPIFAQQPARAAETGQA